MATSKESDSSASRQKFTRHHLGFILAAAAGEFICVGAWFNAAGVFYTFVADDLGVGLGAVGLYMSLSFWSAMVILLFGSKLLDKFGARTVYVVANVLLCAAFAINALSVSLWTMYIAGIMAGAMSAFNMYLLPCMVSRWFKERTGMVLGLESSLAGAGPVVWNIVIALVIQAAGWRVGYAVLAVLVGVIVVPMMFLFMRSYPEEKGVKAYGALLDDAGAEAQDAAASCIRVEGANYADVIKSPAFYLLIVMTMTAGLGVLMVQYLAAFALDMGYAVMIGAAVTSAALVGNMLSKFVFGALSDKSVFLAVLGPVVFPIIGFIGLMAIGGSSALGIMVMAFLYGTIQPSNVTILPLCVRQIFGDKDYDKIWSKIAACSAFAGGIGATLWGWMFDVMGTFYGVFMVGIALLVIRLAAYVIALPIARKLPRNEEVRVISAKPSAPLEAEPDFMHA